MNRHSTADEADALAGTAQHWITPEKCRQVLLLMVGSAGGSGTRAGAAQPASATTLAAQPNVSVKLSEFGLAGGGWDDTSTIRIVRDAVAIFGDDRCLYASNLPVSGLSAPVPRIVAAVLAGLGSRDPERLRRVFSSNARRIYRM